MTLRLSASIGTDLAWSDVNNSKGVVNMLWQPVTGAAEGFANVNIDANPCIYENGTRYVWTVERLWTLVSKLRE
jgi:hypothetical protein